MNARLIRRALDILGFQVAVAFNRRFADDIERVLIVCSKAPVRIGLTLITLGLIPGGILFSVFEPDANVFDGMYWATVVMPTVGFGDFSPATLGGRWVYEWVLVCGRLGEILIAGAFVGAIAQRRLEHHASTPELDDDLEDLKSTVVAKIDALKAITSDPRVKQALRDAHNERGSV